MELLTDMETVKGDNPAAEFLTVHLASGDVGKDDKNTRRRMHGEQGCTLARVTTGGLMRKYCKHGEVVARESGEAGAFGPRDGVSLVRCLTRWSIDVTSKLCHAALSFVIITSPASGRHVLIIMSTRDYCHLVSGTTALLVNAFQGYSDEICGLKLQTLTLRH